MTLPHYAFPLGWRATLNGTPIPIDADWNGLMVLSVGESGLLELRFTTTPARRHGLVVSCVALVLVLAVGLFAVRTSPNADGAPIRSDRRPVV